MKRTMAKLLTLTLVLAMLTGIYSRAFAEEAAQAEEDLAVSEETITEMADLSEEDMEGVFEEDPGASGEEFEDELISDDEEILIFDEEVLEPETAGDGSAETADPGEILPEKDAAAQKAGEQADSEEALTEAAPAENGAQLPAVGDVVCGFEAKEIREFPAIGAQIVLFEHQRTHALLMYIANDDNNRVFDLTFLTDAIDKTGLPHVFEHSVLDGSEKYPSKTLWFNVAYQTYNTYMNAFTQSRMTSYPVASLSEAQLLKYADYYTDACLHPLVVEDEGIYREEAWRYRLENEEDPLTIEGTVYSEMLGAYDISSASMVNAMSTAFPGSTIGNEFGGDPAYIPDMTFESLKNYHALYYHPSNSIAYLYGSFEDYTAFLALLDEAYAPYEYREFVHQDPDYTPLEEYTEAAYAFPVESGSDTVNSSMIYYVIPCPGADAEQELILNTLTDLLTDNASALQQSLQEKLPSGSFYCYIATDGPDPAILFVAENVGEGDAPLFRETVDEALGEVAQNGFPQDQVDGVMTTLRISMLLMREDSSVGVNTIIPDLAYYYSCSGDPFDFVNYIDGMKQMDDWNRQGLYAQAVKDWLVDAPAAALVTTYPQPGLKEENDAALAAKLEEVKASMSGEEIAALVESTNAQEPQEDNTAAVASMQAVTVDSLPEECRIYEVRDETGEDGIRRIDVPAMVDGIGEAALFLDASGVAQDDLHWLQLFADLAGELDTDEHTKAEVASLMSRYLNGCNIYISTPGKGDDWHPYLRMSWIALDEDLAAGYDLVREIVFGQKLEDTQKVLETVQNLKADLKTQITQSPYNVQVIRAYAVSSGLYRYYTYVKQLEYYQFLVETEQLLESDPETAAARLEAIAEQLANSTNAISVYCGSEAGIAVNRPLADAFLDGLGSEPVESVTYDLPVPAKSEALIIDSGVQFNGEYADYAALGVDGFEGGLDAVTSLVLDAILYPMLRDQYGAYGVFHSADEDEGVYVISYRDPNIAQTFEIYEQLGDLVAEIGADQDTLNGYILSAYAGYAKSQGELTGALAAAVGALEGREQERRLEYMRQLKAVTPETVEKYVDMYTELYGGVTFTAGPASAINAEAERYEAILNPFGAVDYSAQGFEDVTEDTEGYEAIMSALESGLMKPLSDTVFGAQEPATQGELAGALYALIGGGSVDPQEAIDTFAEYGYTGLESEAPLTGEEANKMLSWLAEGLWQGEGDGEVMTRAQFAQLLDDFLTAVQGAGDEAA